MPKSPSFPSSGTSSRGKYPFSNHSAMWGSTRAPTKSATVERTSNSSPENSESMARKSSASGIAGRVRVVVILASLAFDGKGPEGLHRRHHLNRIDVHVRGSGRRPVHRIGYVLGTERR